MKKLELKIQVNEARDRNSWGGGGGMVVGGDLGGGAEGRCLCGAGQGGGWGLADIILKDKRATTPGTVAKASPLDLEIMGSNPAFSYV